MSDVKLRVGEPLNIEARVDGYPAPEVKWYKDGTLLRPSEAINFVNLPNGTVGLQIDSAHLEDAGVYSCTIENRLGEVSGVSNADVQPQDKKPEFLTELQDIKAVEGFPVKMEAKVDGHPMPKAKWNHDGEEIRPDGQHFKIVEQPNGLQCLIIDKVAPGDAGHYQVIATNDLGQCGTEATLSVAPKEDKRSEEEPPKFVTLLKNASVDEGKELAISAPFSANPLPEVIWTKDDVPLAPNERVLMTCDGRSVGLIVNPAEVSDAGVYSCLLANPLGEDESKSQVSVRKVYEKPVFTHK